MGKDSKENIDKNNKIPDVGSEKEKLSSLKKEINPEKSLENKDLSREKNELLNLKKEVKEEIVISADKERLSSLSQEIKEKKNTVSEQSEVTAESNVNSDSGKSSFLSKQTAIFSSWKEKNLSRPVDGIESAYMDVTDQIEKGLKDSNIIARGLAKIIKMIIQNEK